MTDDPGLAAGRRSAAIGQPGRRAHEPEAALVRRTVQVGPVDVDLLTDDPGLMSYLAEFYELAAHAPRVGDRWTIEVRRVAPSAAMWRDPWDVGFAVDEHRRTIWVRTQNPRDLRIATRKLARELLVHHCEQLRYVMLHASAFACDDRVIIVVGDKGAGKTTLALRAVLDHGWVYVANDHLILYAEGGAVRSADRLVVTSLPTFIPVKLGTFADLQARLPEPYDTEGIDPDALAAVQPPGRVCDNRRLLYTYRRLGQPNPVNLPLGTAADGPGVIVVLARFTPPGRVKEPVVVEDAAAALWPHVRFDWVFDPATNTRRLPRHQRSYREYEADARRLVDALAHRALVLSWAHHGDPTPLIHGLLGRER